MAENKNVASGRIARVTGPVVDIEFPHDGIPGIYNALTTEINLNGEVTTLTLEVAQHLAGLRLHIAIAHHRPADRIQGDLAGAIEHPRGFHGLVVGAHGGRGLGGDHGFGLHRGAHARSGWWPSLWPLSALRRSPAP